MISDASAPRDGLADHPFDVCIIGAGPAGITLALTLAANGLEVALMEAGGFDYSEQSQEHYRGRNVGRKYFELDAARLRYFGGASNHWGGACRSLDPVDFAERPFLPLSGWPIGKPDLDPFQARADAILGLPAPVGFADEAPDAPDDVYHHVRYKHAGSLHFGEKFRSEIEASDRIRLVLNANLVDLRLDDDLGTVRAAVFRGYEPGDPGFTISARHYALCAGGIENARILLCANGQLAAGIGNGHDLVGRYFCEHPFVSIHDVLFETPLFGTPRFRASEAYAAEHELLNYSVRLVGREEARLSLPRELVREASCDLPFVDVLAERVLARRIDCDTGGLSAYLRQQRASDPFVGSMEIQFEQALDPHSRVKLIDERDSFGLNRIALDWRLHDVDLGTARAAIMTASMEFAAAGLARVHLPDWFLRDDWQAAVDLHDYNGSYHHMCTTRMSDDVKTGVVDRDCRVHSVSNLYIGGSSAFATSGQAVPTYTIVQMALRLGDHIATLSPRHVGAVAPHVPPPTEITPARTL